METIKLIIDETGRFKMNEPAERFNTIRETFHSESELIAYLELRYGKVPKGRNKIYRDTAANTANEVGFTHSFWNRDVSHASKNWYQTDWIEFYKEESKKTYFKLSTK